MFCPSSYFVHISFPPIFFFFFNDTATTEIYTLSYTTLFRSGSVVPSRCTRCLLRSGTPSADAAWGRSRIERRSRSEEHTSELQSHSDLVCRLLLEKKKKKNTKAVMKITRHAEIVKKARVLLG